MYADGLQLKILRKELDLNFGAIYENAIAQELKAHGFDLYYFQSKKQGELDFLIEYQGKVLPIEEVIAYLCMPCDHYLSVGTDVCCTAKISCDLQVT